MVRDRPTRRRWPPVVVAVLLALVGCGRGGGSRSGGAGATGPPSSLAPVGVTVEPTLAPPPDLVATTTTVAATTVVPPPTAPADDLAATTAITPLDGFAELPAGAGIGALDLAAASADDPRERDALTRFHLRDGHARGFVNGGEEIVVSVLRFSTAADAAAYLQDTVDSSLVSNGSFLFAVPVPGATGYREQGAGKDGEPYVAYGAVFARGDRVFEQLVRGPAAGAERTEADAHTLARRQADRVGG